MRETCTSLSSSITIDEYDPLAVFRFGLLAVMRGILILTSWILQIECFFIVFLNHHFFSKNKKQFQKKKHGNLGALNP